MHQNEDTIKLWSFERLFDALQESVWVIDFPVTKHLYFNDATMDLFEATREELIQNPNTWSERMHPDDRAFIDTIQAELFEKGKVTCEYRMIMPSGKLKWINNKIILVKDEKGNPVRIEGISSDITERVDATRARLIDQFNLKAMIDNTHDMIWSIDTKMNLVIANRPLYHYLETVYNHTIKPGESALNIEFDPERRILWREAYERAMKGEFFEIEMISGDELSYEVSFNPIFDDDKNVIGVGCFGRDITGQRINELKIKNQNEKLLQIAKISAHDLRKPVASILGLIDLFDKKGIDKDLNTDTIESLEIVTRQLDSVIRTIVELTYEIDK